MVQWRGLWGCTLQKLWGSRQGWLDHRILFISLKSKHPHYDYLHLLHSRTFPFSLFQPCCLLIRPIQLRISEVLLWHCFSSGEPPQADGVSSRTCSQAVPSFLLVTRSIRVAWKAEVVSTALLRSDSRKLLFAWWPHRDFSIRTWISGAQLSASHSLLICILSEASYFPVIHIYDLSEYMVAPFSVIFQCH